VDLSLSAVYAIESEIKTNTSYAKQTFLIWPNDGKDPEPEKDKKDLSEWAED